MIRRFLFADDIFISYSRKDGAKYAAALANELSKRGHDYSCFLDQWGASADNELSTPVLRALKHSYMLVLIGTAGAAESPLVRQEVQSFSKRRWFQSPRPVLPINIDGALSDLNWSELTGLYRVPETNDARKEGIPSEAVVRLIVNSNSYTKRSQRMRLLSLVATFLLLASIATSVFAAYMAKRATLESERANKESVNAKVQTEAALKNKQDAEREAERAKENANLAQQQQKIADEKAREATAEIQVVDPTLNKVISTSEARIKSGGPVRLIKSPTNGMVVAMFDFDLLLIESHSGKVVAAISKQANAVEFSRDGSLIAVGENNGLVSLYKSHTGELQGSFNGHPTQVTGVCFSRDAQHIMVAGNDNVLRIWRMRAESFEQVGELTGHVAEIVSVKVSHKGDLILTAGVDGTSRLWTTSVFDSKQSQLAALFLFEKLRSARSVIDWQRRRVVRHICGSPSPAIKWSFSAISGGMRHGLVR